MNKITINGKSNQKNKNHTEHLIKEPNDIHIKRTYL